MRAAALVSLAAGCAGPVAVPSELGPVEAGEWLPGGEAGTNTLFGGSNAFIAPMPGLSIDHEGMFYSGNGYFNQAWVEAPASTEARDGLGPLFNARSCSACHFKDGRAAPPEDGLAPWVGLLLRLSVPGPDGAWLPDPTYGGQIQDVANPGLPAEMAPRVTWHEQPGAYPDGAAYSLAAPEITLDAPAYGAPHPELVVSARIAVQIVGLGLLEAVPQARIEALADPEDGDGDGISGRIPWAVDPETGAVVVARMGGKGDSATVAQQVANALAGDMGLTSALHPADDCTEAQPDCLTAAAGGTPEVSDDIFARLVLYSRALAVPAREAFDDERVLRGKWAFHEAGCGACHVATHTTGPFVPVPELEGQQIWPYTDLLLHDLGPELADGRPVGEADGAEWRTRPLWGLGHLPEVNGHLRLLHDGRARGVEEAILWHGGEAEASREAFAALPADDRDAVVTFVESL